jgi:hypothetical protein
MTVARRGSNGTSRKADVHILHVSQTNKKPTGTADGPSEVVGWLVLQPASKSRSPYGHVIPRGGVLVIHDHVVTSSSAAEVNGSFMNNTAA